MTTIVEEGGIAEDRQITCEECQTEFTFTIGEQDHFQKLGFTPPKRCKPCRAARKQAQRSQGH